MAAKYNDGINCDLKTKLNKLILQYLKPGAANNYTLYNDYSV